MGLLRKASVSIFVALSTSLCIFPRHKIGKLQAYCSLLCYTGLCSLSIYVRLVAKGWASLGHFEAGFEFCLLILRCLSIIFVILSRLKCKQHLQAIVTYLDLKGLLEDEVLVSRIFYSQAVAICATVGEFSVHLILAPNENFSFINYLGLLLHYFIVANLYLVTYGLNKKLAGINDSLKESLVYVENLKQAPIFEATKRFPRDFPVLELEKFCDVVSVVDGIYGWQQLLVFSVTNLALIYNVNNFFSYLADNTHQAVATNLYLWISFCNFWMYYIMVGVLTFSCDNLSKSGRYTGRIALKILANFPVNSKSLSRNRAEICQIVRLVSARLPRLYLAGIIHIDNSLLLQILNNAVYYIIIIFQLKQVFK